MVAPRPLAATAGALLVLAVLSAPVGAQNGITTRQSIETSRLVRNPDAVAPGNPDGLISISPDRTRYVLRVVRGDVAANRIVIELYAGRLGSLDGAVPVKIATLTSSGVGIGGAVFGPVHDADEYGSPIRWLDNEHIAFLASDRNDVRQVTRVNVATGRLEVLTAHPTNVVAYDIASNGTIFYNAQAAPPRADSEARLRAGYVVDARMDPSSLFRRDLSGRDLYDNAWATQWFVRERGRSARPYVLLGRQAELHYAHRIIWSPDGLTVLLNATADGAPETWNRYREPVIAARIPELRRDPRGTDARSVHRLFVVDIASGRARPLWDAVNLVQITQAAWSPDSRFVLVTPAYLPPEADESTTYGGSAAAVVEVATGAYRRLPIAIGGPLRVAGLRWRGADRVEIDIRQGAAMLRHRFVLAGGTWSADGEAESLAGGAGIRIELRQGLDTPPRLFALDGTAGGERMILDLNPALAERVALGRAERVQGTLPGGVAWSGLLFHPPGRPDGRRAPLVIQSVYGTRMDDSFTLYGLQGGGGLGPSPIASYPGRALASRGIFVLQLDVAMGREFGTPAEAGLRQQAFETAVAALDARGLIDPARVGLVGFSRNGFYVESALTHSDHPFAAAITADNWDPSYVQQTFNMSALAGGVAVHGGEPFGAGLAAWLERAPGFSTERIGAPLLMIEQSSGLYGVFSRWETFARLRHLRKPVEFYVMPDAEAHGSHNSQNPGQILAVMERSADWFDFWLNEHEDPDPAKAAQYANWRRLRALQVEAARQPRPVALQWRAMPAPAP